MTSGPSRKAAALVALLALGLTGAAARAGPDTPFARLMALLAARERGEVTFVARTYAAGLTRPLESSGVLRYRAPDHLEQRTLKPAPSDLILDGERLTVRRDGHTRHVDLRNYPDIAVYVDALRDTLAGRGAALERRFTVRWRGTLDHWQLTLTPIRAGASVRRIRLAGEAADIRTIEIVAPHGARTVMRLGPPPAA